MIRTREKQTHAADTNTEALFQQSIDIINAGIRGTSAVSREHPHRVDGDAPASPDTIADRLPRGKRFAVAVFEADPSNPEAVYDVRFNGDTFECAARDKSEGANPPVACRLVKSHLEEVCDRPHTYIERPMESALVWMMTRMAA